MRLLIAIVGISALLLFACSSLLAQSVAATASPPSLTAEQKASLREADQLTRTVVQLHAAKKFDEALPLARRAVELRRRALGDNSVRVAQARSDVATLYLEKEDFARAEAEFLQLLACCDNANSVIVYVLDSLSLLRWRVRNYGKAEVYAKRAIVLRQELYGNEAHEVFESIHNLVKVYDAAGKLSERNALYVRVISILEKTTVRPIDRPLLFRYHCSLRLGKQPSDASSLLKRIEALLQWDPTTKAPSSRGVLNGRALSLPTPVYPSEARGASGTVIVEVLIDECGNVSSAKAVSGSPFLRPVSESAAMKAQFSPTLINGIPVRVIGIIQYIYR